jgi:hypothetical protein
MATIHKVSKIKRHQIFKIVAASLECVKKKFKLLWMFSDPERPRSAEQSQRPDPLAETGDLVSSKNEILFYSIRRARGAGGRSKAWENP